MSSKDIVTRLRKTRSANNALFATPIQLEAAGEIERLREENKRLRGLMRGLVDNAEGGDYSEIIVLDVDFIEIEKEVGDEQDNKIS